MRQLHLDQVRQILERSSWYLGLPASLREALLRQGRQLEVLKNGVIATMGDAPRGAFVVLDGSVTCRRDDTERPSILYIGERGFWFDLYAALTGSPSPVTYVARSRALLLHIPTPAFLQLVAEDPAHHRHFSELTLSRYGLMMRWVSEVGGDVPEQALRRRLADLVELKLGHDSTAEPAVAATQSEIAAMLGVSRQTANGLLKELERQGLIEVGFREIRVRDVALLRGLEPEPEPRRVSRGR